MIKFQLTEKNKWLLISGVLWLLLLVFMMTCNTRREDGYRKSIKAITKEQDSLKAVIKHRKQSIDSLKVVINKTEMRIDTINYERDILENKIHSYEKNFVDVRNMSTDSGIQFLSDQLSK